MSKDSAGMPLLSDTAGMVDEAKIVAAPAREWRFAEVFLLAVVIIVIRRWPQFAHPAIWIEDANTVLPELVREGWPAIFSPTGGYLIVPSKLVSYLALRLSFSHYALLSTIISTAVQAACAGLIAIAPSRLPAKTACALAVLLVPVGVEVFAIPLHAFWWTNLLLFPALLWHGQKQTAARAAFVFVGGLSSPLIVILSPMFALRAGWRWNRSEYLIMVIVGVLAALQLAVVLSSPHQQSSVVESLKLPAVLISKYFGTAAYQFDAHLARRLGWVMLLALAGGIVAIPRSDRPWYGLLAFCLAGAVVASVARVPVQAPHPLLAGPRYFFYPTVLVLWMLIWITARGRWLSTRCAALLAICTFTPALAVNFNYAAEKPLTAWEDQVVACAASATNYTFDAQFSELWHVTFSGEVCRQLIAASIIP